MPNINEFKSRLRGGGARANQFKVTLPFPGYAAVGGETSDLAFLCKATAIPGQTIGNIPIDFRGRKLNIAGDRTFEPWTITVLNDTDFKLYRAFERWMNGINNMTDNEGIANPADYQVDGFIDQLDRNGATLKSYDDVTAIARQFQTVFYLCCRRPRFGKLSCHPANFYNRNLGAIGQNHRHL